MSCVLNISVLLLPSTGQGGLQHGISSMLVFVCGIVGVCCGGELHGRVHQTAGEAERLRGSGHGAPGTSWGDRATRAGGHPGVRVDGELPAGNNDTADTLNNNKNNKLLYEDVVLSLPQYYYSFIGSHHPPPLSAPFGVVLTTSCFCLFFLWSSSSSWLSQFCWPGTAGFGKVAWCGPRLRPSPLCRVRPTAIMQRKWPSGSSPMAWTSLLFSKGHYSAVLSCPVSLQFLCACSELTGSQHYI